MLRRLVVSFCAAFAFLIVATGFIIYVLLAARLRSDRVLVLEDRMEAVESLLKSPAHGREELENRVKREWPQRGGEKVFILVTDRDGAVVAETPHAPEGLTAALRDENANVKCGSARSLPSGSGNPPEFLICSAEMENALGLNGPIWVRAAIGEEQSQDFLGTLRGILAAVLLLNIAMSILVGFQIVRHEIAPLREIAKKVARIDSQTLRERIETKDLPEELRSLAGTFNHTFDRLADSFERLSRFSSDIAHELRTPVSNIIGTIEVGLSRERSVEEYRDLLESTLEEAARLRTMTESLLFLARAENSQLRLSRSELPLKSEIETVIEFYEAFAAEKGIALKLDPASPQDLVLLAEPTLFQRALANLLSNAIRHSRSGGTVIIRYGPSDHSVWISVGDSGEGIPEADLERIFQRFYRVDPSRTLTSGGTGLGLAIVKSIVELHGGSVSVASRLGEGSVFTMRWPNVTESLTDASEIKS